MVHQEAAALYDRLGLAANADRERGWAQTERDRHRAALAQHPDWAAETRRRLGRS
jgi:hypothetical protein